MCCVSLVTPPLRVDVDRGRRSAQRSLDFGRCRPHSDPVPLTSDPVRLSNHSCPSLSRRDVCQLDDTLTDADHCEQRPVLDESSQSRWSASDYFRRYPSAWIDSTASCDQRCTDSGHRCVRTDDRQPSTNNNDDNNNDNDNDDDDDDDGGSTLISSIRARSAPSVDGSVGTSSSLDSVSTNDDTAFRAGLAQLDANIARVQRRLQGSLSSASPARHNDHRSTSPSH